MRRCRQCGTLHSHRVQVRDREADEPSLNMVDVSLCSRCSGLVCFCGRPKAVDADSCSRKKCVGVARRRRREEGGAAVVKMRLRK